MQRTTITLDDDPVWPVSTIHGDRQYSNRSHSALHGRQTSVKIQHHRRTDAAAPAIRHRRSTPTECLAAAILRL